MAAVEEAIRAHVWITGTVQTVNFRSSARDEAKKLEVQGWVKNLSDGRVEAVFEGRRAAVQRLVSWCYSGPPHAEVESVEVTWEPPTKTEGPFTIVW